MRLSDIKGERTFDVLADLVDPILNIAEDKEASAFFRDRACPKGMTPSEYAAQKARKSLKPLLKGHKSDLIAIMSALKGQTQEEYAESLSLATLTSDVVELFTDEEFLAFLS